jgi:outer membrane protein assembly factor BamE (lipoprotein component of BamABCDE complex)
MPNSMSPRLTRALPTLAGAALLIALLAGCATPAQLRPGSPAADVQAVGRPSAAYNLPEGRRLEFTMGPFQQETYMVDLAADGSVRQVRQVRTMENFAQLQVGKATRETVLHEFGQPWRVETYTLSRLTAWMYPFIEGGFFPSMMAVHFDQAGVVQLVQNGPDPRFQGGGDRRD